MNIVQLIRDKMCMRVHSRSVTDGQEMALYRQLRYAENKLHDARECLMSMMELQKNSAAEHVRCMQGCDDLEQNAVVEDADRSVDSVQEPQQSDSRRNDLDHQLDALQKNVAFLKNDLPRLEAEYQQAQLNVRTHFYRKTYSGSLTEADVTAGQSA